MISDRTDDDVARWKLDEEPCPALHEDLQLPTPHVLEQVAMVAGQRLDGVDVEENSVDVVDRAEAVTLTPNTVSDRDVEEVKPNHAGKSQLGMTLPVALRDYLD